jgi:ribosomal subunit interface protein
MKTQVAILHRDYPAGVRDTVERKLQQLGRFSGRPITVRANLERQSGGHRVELIANVGRGAVLVADVMHEGFGVALDEAVERMERQLQKHNDKVTIERHRGGRTGHVA